MQKEIRIGIGYDIHRFAAGRRSKKYGESPPWRTQRGRKLMLGGVHIKHKYGLLGHSDADALLHAVCDAVLGGLGLCDRAEHHGGRRLDGVVKPCLRCHSERSEDSVPAVLPVVRRRTADDRFLTPLRSLRNDR